MTALGAAAHRWNAGSASEMPHGVTVTPVDIESGYAASHRVGLAHLVADAALISDGTETRLAVAWLCGGSSVDAVEVPHDPDPELLCSSCVLAAAVPQRPCVYFAWGDGDELLYIGSTTNAMLRIRSHVNGTPWWPEVRRLTFTEYEKEADARRAESSAIWNRPSKYNRAGTQASGRMKARDFLGDITISSEGGAA